MWVRRCLYAVGAVLCMSAAATASRAQAPAVSDSMSAQAPSVPPASDSMPPPQAAAAYPTRLEKGARLFIPQSEFGMALTAAILKKKVPVVTMTDSTKADFFVSTVSNATTEKTGVRIVKILAFGAGAGSGRHFDATVTVMNRDGAVVFAHNSKKDDFQSAAENVAKNLKKQIEAERQ